MTDVLNWDTVRMEAVEIVLKGWTALDLQIQHNPHHSEIRKWLPEPISTALKYVLIKIIRIIKKNYRRKFNRRKTPFGYSLFVDNL